jgi:hypothetical protein
MNERPIDEARAHLYSAIVSDVLDGPGEIHHEAFAMREETGGGRKKARYRLRSMDPMDTDCR